MQESPNHPEKSLPEEPAVRATPGSADRHLHALGWFDPLPPEKAVVSPSGRFALCYDSAGVPVVRDRETGQLTWRAGDAPDRPAAGELVLQNAAVEVRLRGGGVWSSPLTADDAQSLVVTDAGELVLLDERGVRLYNSRQGFVGPVLFFEGSAPAADITVERMMYLPRAEGVQNNVVRREPDGALRVGDTAGHYFLAPPLARWLEQDNTVLTWRPGVDPELCLVDEAGNVLWREHGLAGETLPPATPHDYGGPALGLGARLLFQSLTSVSGSHTLLHQIEGNVVLYCHAGHEPVWSTDTWWVGASRLELTPDGDLVLRTSCGAPVWRSDTADQGVHQLVVRDDGSIALVDASGTAVWQTDGHAPCTAAGHVPPRGSVLRRGEILHNQSLTADDGGAVLHHRAGVGLRLFRADRRQVWYAPDSRDPGGYLTLDDEGYLQIRTGDGSVYEQLAGPGDHLVVVPGGEIRLCAADGTVVWRAGQRVLESDDDIVRSAPRPVTPAAAEALLNTEETPIVRTDFSDDHAWETAWRDITLPRKYWEHEFVVGATLVDLPEFDGWSADELAALLSDKADGRLLIVDGVTLASAEHPVLVVELDPEREQLRSFRATPLALLDVEVQLGIANMDWEDFSESTDPDGILRTSMAD